MALYAVCEVDSPLRVRVFEIYRISTHISPIWRPHFKQYKATTEKIVVRSLKLFQTTPIVLGAKTG